MKIAVLGAGAWGTAISITLAARHEVTLWSRDREQCRSLEATRSNERYLPGFTLPLNIGFESDFPRALSGRELALVAVPTAGLREVLSQAREAGYDAPIIWLCKGFERERAKLPHEIHAEVFGGGAQHAVLSGPSFAQEVASGLPTAVTLAAPDSQFARTTARALHGPAFRVYSSDDVVGVEVAGAVKNVMAIAAGICDGLALGLNARAALITRGLAEITRLGVRLGGRPETFMGLAGAGDLILTCTGDLSRNRRVGLQLAQGLSLEAILAGLGHVAEGVHTARELARLATRLAVDMPITHAVCSVLEEPAAARAAVQALLQREPKSEY